MFATLGELDWALDDLRERIPALIAKFGSGEDFWSAFDGYAGIIVEDASPENLPHVRDALATMLAAVGLRRVNELRA